MRFRSKERGTRVKDRAKNGKFYFSRGQNRESRSSVFETKQKRLLLRLRQIEWSNHSPAWKRFGRRGQAINAPVLIYSRQGQHRKSRVGIWTVRISNQKAGFAFSLNSSQNHSYSKHPYSRCCACTLDIYCFKRKNRPQSSNSAFDSKQEQ